MRAVDLPSPVTRLCPISLEELDERAALLKSVDVLEIDGRRRFSYDTVYYDTADLRCFRDHNEDVRPRFKSRRRCYVDAGDCVCEVKVKREDGETDKQQAGDLDEALREAGVVPPGELAETLRTAFDRVTLAAREGGARLTVDLGVTLSTMDGESPADAVLRELGARPVSLSKYRVGIDALVQREDDDALADVRRLFA